MDSLDVGMAHLGCGVFCPLERNTAQRSSAMKVQFEIQGLKKTKWYQFALRVLFGGVVTVITGIIAKKFGPVVGGLFLAFPAIFPASVTLVERHEQQKKEQKGVPGSMSGR